MRRSTFNTCISEHRFRDLFIELEWNNSRGEIYLSIDDVEYTFRYVAEMRGFRVITCEVDVIPSTSLCKRIDTKLRPSAQDYILIFHIAGREHQKWVIPVRNVDKRDLVSIEYQSAEQADFIYNKVEGLNFDGQRGITLPDVKASVQEVFAVNSERITKDFFREFKTEHKAFLSMITGLDDHIADKENRNKDWYTSVMLNRLMFCYFIQKKGFLDGDVNYLHNKLRWTQGQGRDQFFGSFYKGFLCSLFHDGLNSPRHEADFRKKYGQIPYLNGGMFDEHQLEKEYAGIDIKDEAFERLFAFFDKWNWHLDTRLTASGKDINPDVLGYIFEQYINDRAAMGAYYTKEDITEYIGKNCILPFLIDKTAAATKDSARAFESEGWVWKMLRESGDKYIYDAVKKGYSADWQQRIPDYIRVGIDTKATGLLERRKRWNEKTHEEFALPTEIWRETIERLQRCDDLLQKIADGEIHSINDFITYNLDIRQFVEDLIRQSQDHHFVAHFYRALQGVTILDPTCGSGAFLFAALNILEPLYEACLDRMEEWHEQNAHLFADQLEEINAKYSSNRQYFIYKSIILRNLYGVDIMVEATEIAKLRLFLKMVAVVEVDKRKDNLGLDPLPDIDFNIKCGNTLVGYATEAQLDQALAYGDMYANLEFKDKINTEMQVVAKAYTLFRSEQLKTYDDNASIKATKEDLKQRLSNLNDLLNRYMHQAIAYGTNYDAWLKSHQPFHWLAEFYQIIKGNGGFDVIIGNPPYVVYTKKDAKTKKAISDYYKLKDYGTISCNNLYAFVLERCQSIIHNVSYFGMIIPISCVSNDKFVPLLNILQSEAHMWYSSYSNRPGKLFENVEQRLTIVLGYKSKNKDSAYFASSYQHWVVVERPILFSRICYELNHRTNVNLSLFKVGKNIEKGIYKKLTAQTEKLGSMLGSGTKYTYYHNAPTYFIRAMSVKPNSQPGMQESSHYKSLKSDNNALVTCVLNSSVYYWFYKNISNCRDYSDKEINSFPIGNFTDNMKVLQEKLQTSYDVNKTIKNRTYESGLVYYEEYYPAKSKPIIDEIDKVLAKHYGFTEEELDFIINYDIKYRMGDELNTED